MAENDTTGNEKFRDGDSEMAHDELEDAIGILGSFEWLDCDCRRVDQDSLLRLSRIAVEKIRAAQRFLMVAP